MNLMEVDSQRFQDITSYVSAFLGDVAICRRFGRDPSRLSFPL